MILRASVPKPARQYKHNKRIDMQLLTRDILTFNDENAHMGTVCDYEGKKFLHVQDDHDNTLAEIALQDVNPVVIPSGTDEDIVKAVLEANPNRWILFKED